MIDFLKTILQRLRSKSKNKELTKFNRILYSIILLCAILFVVFLVYTVIQAWPDFVAGWTYNWNNSKFMLREMH